MEWQDCLKDENKIFNMDETSFCVNPTLGKVLAKRGTKNIYTMSVENEKDCYTVLLGGKSLKTKKSCFSLILHSFPEKIAFIIIFTLCRKYKCNCKWNLNSVLYIERIRCVEQHKFISASFDV